MNIVLSRKGFDSGAGGVPSPILPDGRIVSLPIPDPRSPVRYGEIDGPGRPIGQLVSNLTRGRIRRTSRAHLDPDLVAADIDRPEGWQPLLGQEGAAQGHLRNEGVGPGDVFVFFGLFQRATFRAGRYDFDRNSPRVHLVWGWMQVDRVIAVADCQPDLVQRIGRHPHFHHGMGPDNVLYLGRRRLDLGLDDGGRLPGSGSFERYRRVLQLSDPNAGLPSRWRVPQWLAPRPQHDALSYHRNLRRWREVDGVTRLDSAARGQEFVLSAEAHPEALRWLARLIRRHGVGSNGLR